MGDLKDSRLAWLPQREARVAACVTSVGHGPRYLLGVVAPRRWRCKETHGFPTVLVEAPYLGHYVVLV